MINPMMGEATAEPPGGLKFDLVVNNMALVCFEGLIGMSFLDGLDEMVKAEMAGKSPKLGTTGALLYAATRDKHPDLSLDECYGLIREYGGAVMGPLGAAVRGALKIKDDDQGEAEPAPAPAKRKRGAGTRR